MFGCMKTGLTVDKRKGRDAVNDLYVILHLESSSSTS